MSDQFSKHSISLLADVTLLNRAIYGGPDALQETFLDDYKENRDPDNVGNRDALFVYDRYDRYLKQFDFTTLSSDDLGFASADIGADEETDGLDHNYTYAGGLFRNNFMPDGEGGETEFTAAGAVALTTLKKNDDGNTLYLTFRGTDADGPLADGEAGSAAGQMRYYGQLKSLIDQIYDYVSKPGNDITEIVVSGHSLGGTVADLFALYDGARFDAIDGVKLSVIALASAGVAPELLEMMPGYDDSMVDIGDGGEVTFNTPNWYFQYDQQQDIVRNPDQYDAVAHAASNPSNPAQPLITGFAVGALANNLHFDDNRLQFETPLIDQYEVSADLATNFLVNHYADFYELIGTEFSKAWTEVGDMTFDAFIALFGVSDILKGTPGSNNVNGWGVSPNGELNYEEREGDLFLLGFSGKDGIRTGEGADFISGGAGDDKLISGAGNDTILGDISGKKGDDVIKAGDGDDILIGGKGRDSLKGQAGIDTFVFRTNDSRDTVSDFDAKGGDHDLIDLSDVKSIKNWADLKADHLDSRHGDVLIDAGHGDVLVLKDVKLSQIDQGDFLL